MKKQVLITALFSCSLLGSAQASSVILLDFGDREAAPTHGGTWNTLTDGQVNSTVSNLLFSDGTMVDDISITTANWNTADLNQTGWNGGNNLDWVDSVVVDDGYWRGSNSTSITLSGLDTSLLYDIELVTARAEDFGNRVSDILVQNTFTTVDTSSEGFNATTDGWDNQSILRWANVAPNQDGDILINFNVSGSNTTFINAMQVTVIPEPSTYALFAGLGGLSLIILRRIRQRRY